MMIVVCLFKSIKYFRHKVKNINVNYIIRLYLTMYQSFVVIEKQFKIVGDSIHFSNNNTFRKKNGLSETKQHY